MLKSHRSVSVLSWSGSVEICNCCECELFFSCVGNEKCCSYFVVWNVDAITRFPLSNERTDVCEILVVVFVKLQFFECFRICHCHSIAVFPSIWITWQRCDSDWCTLDCHFAFTFDLESFQIFQACDGFWQLGDLCECVSFASFMILLEFRIPGCCGSKATPNSSAVQWIQAV